MLEGICGYYGTGTVISLTVHKSIYRHMFLWLEIDFIPVYFEGYYGTGIRTGMEDTYAF